MATQMERAVNDIIFTLTFDGGIKRSHIYNGSPSTAEKQKLHTSLKRQLKKTLEEILKINDYSDEIHYEMITSFAATISKKHKQILRGGKFRIGIAQKFLNLYWKMSWILKKGVREPEHCPFDSIIINKLKKVNKSLEKMNWTDIEDIADYKKLVESAKTVIKREYSSIAQWEYEVYLNSRRDKYEEL